MISSSLKDKQSQIIIDNSLLVTAKKFPYLLKRVVCRLFRSLLASPLQMARKKCEDWRFCGVNSRLNCATSPDRHPIPYFQDITQCQIFAKNTKLFFTIGLVKLYYYLVTLLCTIPLKLINKIYI